MNLQITCKNFDLTPSIEEKIRKKLNVIAKFKRNQNSHIHWVCWSEHNQFYSEVYIRDVGKEVCAVASDHSLYKTIDLAIQKLKKQISKEKEMKSNHIHLNYHPEFVF